ncbi:hypothetical protein TELCIR_13427 [Teladorsagia circumcincta]|uniref:N-acetyltransferase domain-containing protein n=1 Tax=Teladorsagia circumcincta TaxID=45464 RepID=A0A2G9U3S6_TELCI|nr:hypothetical protein TELCIR_13427 [Teladorsagia circumcincta]
MDEAVADAANNSSESSDVVMTEVQGAVHGIRSEWRRRFDELENTVGSVNKFFKYIVDCPNKDRLVTLSITSVDYPNVPFALQKEIFLDKFILPFLDASPQYCFMAQELVSSSEKKIICSVSAHPDARSFFDKIPSLVSSLRAKYDGLDSEKFDVDEIEKWFPTVLDDIFDRYPAWLDARLLVDAYDSVPTKKLVQVAAATLFVNGCSGVFVTIPNEHEDHISFYSRLGFSELGKSIDGRFTIFGHRLAVDEEFRE